MGEEHDWLGFGPRAAVLPDLVAVRGNTQSTPAGGDLFPDPMASLTERNRPAVTDVRARMEVGPTRSCWRVTHGCCMGLSSVRTLQEIGHAHVESQSDQESMAEMR